MVDTMQMHDTVYSKCSQSSLPKRQGFTRMSVRFQGLVGVPMGTKEEQGTRLTWLVNTDLGGIIPRAFCSRVWRGLMWLPMGKVSLLQEQKEKKSAAEVVGSSESESKLLTAARAEIEALKEKVSKLEGKVADLLRSKN